MDHTIQIEVFDGRGSMTYTPSMLRVAPDDTVTWCCPSGHFAIMFKDGSPFTEGMDAFSSRETPSSPKRVAKGIKGQFHYAVAIFDGSRIFMDAGCPMILVN
jgi:plastocyanin